MEPNEANQMVQEILNALIPLGLAPAGTPFILPGGGILRPEPHPELATYWRPMWRPADGLEPRDFEGWPARSAAQQIARYRYRGYVAQRKRLDDMMRTLTAEAIRPIESHGILDSYLAGRYGVTISERTRGTHEPAYALVLRPSPIPEIVQPGQAIPDFPDIDVTDRSAEDILAFIRGRAA